MDLGRKIPSYLTGRPQLAATVVFAALFAIVVLLVTVQYDTHNWFSIGPTATFGYTTAFILLCLAILAVSRWFMFRVSASYSLDWGRYLLWNVGEVALIAIVYSSLTVHLQEIGLVSIPELGYSGTLARSFIVVFLLIGIPYLIAGLYFALQDKDNTIRVMNYGNVVTDSEPAPLDREKVTLFGDDGLLKLSISLKNIFFIESDDNYIKVWYSDSEGGVKQYMLRCRLKTVEESFSGSPLVRCHRKYIVNLMRVDLISREKDGYYLRLDLQSSEPIPVSKTYEQQLLSRFNSR